MHTHFACISCTILGVSHPQLPLPRGQSLCVAAGVEWQQLTVARIDVVAAFVLVPVAVVVTWRQQEILEYRRIVVGALLNCVYRHDWTVGFAGLLLCILRECCPA